MMGVTAGIHFMFVFYICCVPNLMLSADFKYCDIDHDYFYFEDHNVNFHTVSGWDYMRMRCSKSLLVGKVSRVSDV